MAIKLPEIVYHYIVQEHMLSPGDAVLVAFSGGADSMALLHVLLGLRERLGLRAVTAAHLHHGLRGAEADRDERFVREQCARLEVPLTVRHVDVAAEAQRTGEGLEEAGRRLRYAWFAELTQGVPRQRIATAHTLSDNMETVLFSMARGCGLNGLCGIPPMRGEIVRPLLTCSRTQIESYCAAQDLPFVTDSTNQSDRFTRNRLRQRVVPELYAVNPRADAAFLRMLTHLREDAVYLEEQARQALIEARGGAGRYVRGTLSALAPALRMRALALAAEECGAPRCEEQHLRALDRLLTGTGAVTLPGGQIARASGRYLYIGVTARFRVGQGPHAVDVDGTYEYCGRIYTPRLLSLEEVENVRKIYKNVLKNAFDYDKIRGVITWRERLPGDAYHPVGRQGGKTLKKLFNEAKIPVELRGGIPILCDEDGIVLVPGFGCDRRVAVDDETRRVFYWQEQIANL